MRTKSAPDHITMMPLPLYDMELWFVVLVNAIV